MALAPNPFEKAFDSGIKFLEDKVSKNIDYQKWFSLLGLSYLSWQGLKCLRFFYRNFLRPRRDLLTRYGESSWVLIIGASGGLGRAFCEAFADAGFNIILCGRNRAKLELTKQFIRSRNSKTETRIVLSDLREAVNGHEFATHIIREIGDLDVSILVNSVAVSDNEFFHNREDKSLVEEMGVNFIAPTVITQKVIPLLLKRAKRGAIINVSSGYGIRPTPYTISYSPSMTFVDYITRTIALEIKEKVDVISVTPYEMKTNLMFNQAYSNDTILPKNCAEAVLNSLGYENRTEGYWKHQIIGSALDSLPEIFLNKLYQRIGPRYIEWRKVQASKDANKI